MILCRVFFDCFEDHFCIDRKWDTEKSDQENSDAAIGALIATMQDHKIIPCLKLMAKERDKAVPVFMNAGALPYIQVVNIGKYAQKDNPLADDPTVIPCKAPDNTEFVDHGMVPVEHQDAPKAE